jgi:hypothetical protein
MHRDIFDAPKGNGYWAWKPLIMLDALRLGADNHIIYMDSSVVPSGVVALRGLIDVCRDITSIYSSFVNRDWTKPECFRAMGCLSSKYKAAQHAWAGVVCIDPDGKSILDEWRKFCLMPEAVADDPTFPNHRHDQSILTNLLVKHNKPLYATNAFQDILDYGGTYKRPTRLEEA